MSKKMALWSYYKPQKNYNFTKPFIYEVLGERIFD